MQVVCAKEPPARLDSLFITGFTCSFHALKMFQDPKARALLLNLNFYLFTYIFFFVHVDKLWACAPGSEYYYFSPLLLLLPYALRLLMFWNAPQKRRKVPKHNHRLLPFLLLWSPFFLWPVVVVVVVSVPFSMWIIIVFHRLFILGDRVKRTTLLCWAQEQLEWDAIPVERKSC